MSNRFKTFTDDELRAFEVLFCRTGGPDTGFRGVVSEMLNELIEEIDSRNITLIKRADGSSCTVTGSVYFEKETRDV